MGASADKMVCAGSGEVDRSIFPNPIFFPPTSPHPPDGSLVSLVFNSAVPACVRRFYIPSFC